MPIGGLYATYHLLREPKTTIENTVSLPLKIYGWKLEDTISLWDGLFLGANVSFREGYLNMQTPLT